MDNNTQPTTPDQNQTLTQPSPSPVPPILSNEIENSLSQQDLHNGIDPKKSNKKKMIIFSILAVLVLIIGLGIVLIGGKSVDKKTENSPKVVESTPTTKQTPESVVAELDKQAIELHKKQKAYKYEIFKTDSHSYGFVDYKVEGAKYFVKSLPQANSGFWHRTDPADKNLDSFTAYTESQKSLKNTLESLDEYITKTLNFKKIDTIKIEGDASDWSWNIYSKDDVLCKLDAEPNFGINAGCITKDKLTKAAEEVKPFVDIYLKTGEDKYQSFGPVKETEGKNDYKITKLGTNHGPLVFVKNSSQTTWKYIGVPNYQSLEVCSFYSKDTDVRLAFQGENCYDETTKAQSTVK